MTGPAHPEEVLAADEARIAAQFVDFMKAATIKRQPAGARRRFNQGRATACVTGEFRVLDGLAAEHRVGLFASPVTFPAAIRFANATSASDRDRDIRGMSVRVHDVRGPNLTEGMNACDFVLNSHPVMMVPDTRAFLELIQASEAGGFRRALYFLAHPKALRIATAARTNPTCHLDLSYWSTTPYLFGPGRAVKYIVWPASARRSPKPESLTGTYLEDAMRTRLSESEAVFDFMVQFHVDRARTPIEDASAEWRQEDSPYVRIAQIRIPTQEIGAPNGFACEQMAFNPWHCRPEHRPLGNMNRARRVIYEAMAAFRAETIPA